MTARGRSRTAFMACAVLMLIVGGGATTTALVALRPHMPPKTPRAVLQLRQLQAVWTGQSYAYLLWPKDDGPGPPALIDGGSDPEARAICMALKARGYALDDITAVLLTHGHTHHTAGLMRLPHAAVYLAMADGALARADVGPNNFLMRLRHRLEAPKRLRRAFVPLFSGQRLVINGHTLQVLALPGHTLGSLAYGLWDGLIVGDAVHGPSLCSGTLMPNSRYVAERAQLVGPVLQRIAQAHLQVAYIADGHTGIILREDCEEKPPPP